MKSLASKIGTLKRKMVDISDELDIAFIELNDAVCNRKQEISQYAQQKKAELVELEKLYQKQHPLATAQISLKIQKRLMYLHRTKPIDLNARAEELTSLLDYVDSL